jgi:proteic killer suppression protein
MIRSFRDKDTERLWRGEVVRRLDGVRKSALMRLGRLESAMTVGDLAGLSGNRLQALKGDRAGQWSIRINDQWRICFVWGKDDPGPSEVEIVDYH